MRVSYNWLKEYVDIKISPEELAEKMTRSGIEVEAVEYMGRGLDKVVVAQVLEKKAHPESNHLSVCRVISGEDVKMIVCGAPNVEAGQKVALALPGAVLPGGKVIGTAVVAGIESGGMICSMSELGLDEHANKGIWVLPDDLAVGTELVDALDIKDAVLVLGLTPNRSECLGMLNVAREVAAVCGEAFSFPPISYPELGSDIANLADIEIEDKTLCPRYTVRIVQGVHIAPSPLWMQMRLLAAGMRPLNNVVDIANYVMLEMNQPLHTFDYKNIGGKKIIVRRARDGETMTTIDGNLCELSPQDLMICDNTRPVCIAGVMGGAETEVTGQTTDILIESACFDRLSIRKTARKFNIPSEASVRFEKGVDIEATDVVARRISQLLVELCGGIAARGVLDFYPQKTKLKHIRLSIAKVNNLLGTAYTLEQSAAVMKRLSFPVERVENDLLVTVPNYRADIAIEEDLIEEIARLMGYDNIPTVLPQGNSTQGGRNSKQSFKLRLEDICAGLGLYESVNYSFISSAEWDKLMLDKVHQWCDNLEIMNPLNEDQRVMRTTLLPGLLNNALRNQNKRTTDAALFETGTVFNPVPERQLPDEAEMLCIVLMGNTASSWHTQGTAYDYYHIKGIWENIADSFRLDYKIIPVDPAVYPFLHPGKSARITVNGEAAGYMGALHPAVGDNYSLDSEVFVLEISLDKFYAALPAAVVAHGVSKYPAITRDIAVIGNVDIPAAEAESIILGSGGEYLISCRLFDVYSGAGIETGKRSLAYALTFQNTERTLTDSEIDEAFGNIVNELQARLGLCLR